MSAGGKHAVGARDGAGRADGAAGRHLEVARIDVRFVVRELGTPESARTIFERGFIASSVKRNGKPRTISDRPRARNRGQAGVRDLLGQPDIDVQAERRRDFVLEEPSQAAVLRIDTAQQLALVVAERDGVVGLACAGLPRWFLAGQDDRQPIESATMLRSTGSSSANRPAWCASS